MFKAERKKYFEKKIMKSWYEILLNIFKLKIFSECLISKGVSFIIYKLIYFYDTSFYDVKYYVATRSCQLYSFNVEVIKIAITKKIVNSLLYANKQHTYRQIWLDVGQS